ncbi:MAG: hypothetical protein R3C45_20615 [Phycisphaerales bacterium]
MGREKYIQIIFKTATALCLFVLTESPLVAAVLHASASTSANRRWETGSVNYSDEAFNSVNSVGTVNSPAINDAAFFGATSQAPQASATAFGFQNEKYPEGRRSRIAFSFTAQGTSVSTSHTNDTAESSASAYVSLSTAVVFYDDNIRQQLEGTTGSIQHVYRVQGQATAHHSVAQANNYIPPGASGYMTIGGGEYWAYGEYTQPTSNYMTNFGGDRAKLDVHDFEEVFVDQPQPFNFVTPDAGQSNFWVLSAAAAAYAGYNAEGSKSATASVSAEWLGVLIKDQHGNAIPFAAIDIVEVFGTSAGDALTQLIDIPTIALPGDLDGDGFVGINDLNLVLSNWNLTVPAANPLADANGDNYIGIEDLNAVLGNWNVGTPPADQTNIPEPTTLVFGALGALTFLRGRTT